MKNLFKAALEFVKLANQVLPLLFSKRARLRRRISRLKKEQQKLMEEYYNALAEGDEKKLNYLYYRIRTIGLELGWLHSQEDSRHRKSGSNN